MFSCCKRDARLPAASKIEKRRAHVLGQLNKVGGVHAAVDLLNEYHGLLGTNAQSTVICGGEKNWLQCPQYELIKVKAAFWGREDQSTCPKAPAGLTTERLCGTNPANTTQKVKGQCENEQACELVASNIFFDDNTCGNVYKYLKVEHECVPDSANAVDVLK
uniref:SUEL-type lectin domain-containing protein n=1 Tax=Eutreptiella gymnastica TaxID=73025 RepID=A0A7S4LF31_9EUGL